MFGHFTYQYKGIYQELKKYWQGYGGLPALIGSPFFHLAIIITAFSYPLWFNSEWWVTVTSIIPGLLGFTLGGFAIWLAIGDGQFKELLAGSTEKTLSPFIKLNYAFLHFVIVQIIALIFALSIKGFSAWGLFWSSEAVFIVGGIGYLLFIYAILSSFATVLAILRYARWYDEFIAKLKNEKLNSMSQNKPKEQSDSSTH